MNSLIKIAVLAAVAYFAWDMFGDSWMKSFESATESAKEKISGVITARDDADFVLLYDSKAKRFTVTSPHDPHMSERVTEEFLASHLRSGDALVPHVQVIYDASAFATSAEQAGFESAVRRQVVRANGRATFSPTGRPKTY